MFDIGWSEMMVIAAITYISFAVYTIVAKVLELMGWY